ncbi:MAG: hypothetical protein RL672_1029 [Actinomycetota bacterium]|jgi:16S rRNA (guanine966-N2)-methyltransferase
MTRIIAGIAGSRQLAAPVSPTRPTSDRIRESIFNRLENWDALEGARVVDLYAGTGALALEAISRGAASAVLVEKDAKAAAVCAKNIGFIEAALQAAKVKASMRVQQKSVDAYLSTAGSVEFDLVFIDPPYDIENRDITENLGKVAPLLAMDAIVVLERSSRTPRAELPADLVLEDEKSYGDTVVYWIGRAADQTANDEAEG